MINTDGRPTIACGVTRRDQFVDTQSSASRQHYIDTGRYLTPDEVREYAADDPGELGEAHLSPPGSGLIAGWKNPVTVPVDRIIAYEAGELSSDEALQLIADLVRSGQAWHLQGSYGRFAAQLILAGRITEMGVVIHDPVEADADPEVGRGEGLDGSTHAEYWGLD